MHRQKYRLALYEDGPRWKRLLAWLAVALGIATLLFLLMVVFA